MEIIAFTFMRLADLKKNAQNLTALTLIQERVIFWLISGPSNPLEAFMKNMMMSKNANMFKNKNKKRPYQHDAKDDDGQDQQQQWDKK